MNWTPGSQPSKIILLLGMVLLALFQLTTPKAPSRYISFIGLRWQELSSASSLPKDENLPNSSATFFAQPSRNDGRTGRGTSEPFRIPGQLLRFEQAGRMPHTALTPVFTLSSPTGTELFEFRAPTKELSSKTWTPFEVVVPRELVGQEAQLTVKMKNNVDADSWFALRNRVDVLEAPGPLANFTDRHPILSWVILGFATLGLLIISYQLFQRTLGNPQLFLIFLIVATLVHFRTSIFFYWDEWDIIWLFKQDLLSGIVRTHNEHFIPFFFSLYYLENLIFGDKYLLYMAVSYFLHAVNAVFVCLLLSALGDDSLFARRVAQLVAFCFLVSGLHPENMHWAVQQVDLLCEGSVILALFAAARFMKNGRSKKLVQVGLAVFSAPLFFGNGLVAAPKVVALGILAPLSAFNLSRVVKLAVTAGVTGGCAVALYLTHPPSTPPDSSRVFSLSELHRMLDYNVTSTHLGTFLRALGLFPYLNARAPQEIFGGLSLLGGEPELGLGWVGFGVSLGILIVGVLLRGGWNFVRLWVLGEAVMVLSMLLPSFGRTKFGLFQGLSLRYTYSTLVGASIVIFALILVVGIWLQQRDRQTIKWFATVSYGYLLWVLGSGLYISRNEKFFTDIGYTNLLYRSQLLDWQNKPGADGYAPTFPANIAPGATPDKAYEVLKFLNPN